MELTSHDLLIPMACLKFYRCSSKFHKSESTRQTVSKKNGALGETTKKAFL